MCRLKLAIVARSRYPFTCSDFIVSWLLLRSVLVNCYCTRQDIYTDKIFEKNLAAPGNFALVGCESLKAYVGLRAGSTAACFIATSVSWSRFCLTFETLFLQKYSKRAEGSCVSSDLLNRFCKYRCSYFFVRCRVMIVCSIFLQVGETSSSFWRHCNLSKIPAKRPQSDFWADCSRKRL